MQESGIRQHPGTRGYGSDSAFLAEAKYMNIAYRQSIFGAASSEDNFGWYGDGISNKFRCTQGDQSTTQWWLGAHLYGHNSLSVGQRIVTKYKTL